MRKHAKTLYKKMRKRDKMAYKKMRKGERVKIIERKCKKGLSLNAKPL